LNLGPIDFELDSKLAVGKFRSNNHDETEFGEVIRRQTNKIILRLAKTITYVISLQVLVDIL
jgi:hypothetical protein